MGRGGTKNGFGHFQKLPIADRAWMSKAEVPSWNPLGGCPCVYGDTRRRFVEQDVVQLGSPFLNRPRGMSGKVGGDRAMKSVLHVWQVRKRLMGVFPPLRVNHVLENSRIRVGHVEISADDSRGVTVSRGYQEDGPKEGLAYPLDFLTLLGPCGQVDIVYEDGGSFNANSEGMPPT